MGRRRGAAIPSKPKIPISARPGRWFRAPTAADVDRAVAAARKAFRAPSWARISATARGALLRRLADLIAAEAERLAEIETRDNGKLITEMRAQLRYIPQWFHYFGGLADKIEGRVIPIDKPGMFNFTREEPLGVVAAITPWNSPLMLATLEARAGSRGGQHGRVEAFGVLVRVGARIRPAVREGGLSARRREHRDRVRLRDRRAPRHASRMSRRSPSPAATAPDRASTSWRRGPSSRSRSSLAANPPTSCSRTPRSTMP